MKKLILTLITTLSLFVLMAETSVTVQPDGLYINYPTWIVGEYLPIPSMYIPYGTLTIGEYDYGPEPMRITPYTVSTGYALIDGLFERQTQGIDYMLFDPAQRGTNQPVKVESSIIRALINTYGRDFVSNNSARITIKNVRGLLGQMMPDWGGDMLFSGTTGYLDLPPIIPEVNERPLPYGWASNQWNGAWATYGRLDDTYCSVESSHRNLNNFLANGAFENINTEDDFYQATFNSPLLSLETHTNANIISVLSHAIQDEGIAEDMYQALTCQVTRITAPALGVEPMLEHDMTYTYTPYVPNEFYAFSNELSTVTGTGTNYIILLPKFRLHVDSAARVTMYTDAGVTNIIGLMGGGYTNAEYTTSTDSIFMSKTPVFACDLPENLSVNVPQIGQRFGMTNENYWSKSQLKDAIKTVLRERTNLVDFCSRYTYVNFGGYTHSPYLFRPTFSEGFINEAKANDGLNTIVFSPVKVAEFDWSGDYYPTNSFSHKVFASVSCSYLTTTGVHTDTLQPDWPTSTILGKPNSPLIKEKIYALIGCYVATFDYARRRDDILSVDFGPVTDKTSTGPNYKTWVSTVGRPPGYDSRAMKVIGSYAAAINEKKLIHHYTHNKALEWWRKNIGAMPHVLAEEKVDTCTPQYTTEITEALRRNLPKFNQEIAENWTIEHLPKDVLFSVGIKYNSIDDIEIIAFGFGSSSNPSPVDPRQEYLATFNIEFINRATLNVPGNVDRINQWFTQEHGGGMSRMAAGHEWQWKNF